MLARRDAAKAKALQERVVGGVVRQTKKHPVGWRWDRYREEVNYFRANYSPKPAEYHAAQKEILEALDSEKN